MTALGWSDARRLFAQRSMEVTDDDGDEGDDDDGRDVHFDRRISAPKVVIIV